MKELAGGKEEDVTSQHVAKACAQGDAAAREVWLRLWTCWRTGWGTSLDLLEPDVIVVGGGVSLMLTPFLNKICERWKGACLNPAPPCIPLVQARYGEDAGIAGAAALCGIVEHP